MSSLTLSINGTSYIAQYVTGSMKVHQQLNNKGDTLNIQLVQIAGQSQPQRGQEIIFKDGARFLFAGFITKIDSVELGIGQQFVMNVEALDYTYILNNKIAIKTYSGQGLYYIVNDLMTNFVPSGYGFTWGSGAVENPGPIINTIYFNYVTIRKCLEKLASMTGYNWWVDYQKVIHFVAATALASPEAFKDSAPSNHQSINISMDTSQVRNSIVMKGGMNASTGNATNRYTGDGNARQWFLQDQPTATPTVTVDGVSKTVGNDPTDNEADFNYMYSSDQKYVRASSGTTTLTTSNVIQASYPYNVPILAIQEDAAAIAIMKALEGGDGRHQYAITDNTVRSKAEARQKAKTQLQLYAYPLLTGVVKTRTSLLQAGSYFTPGNYVIINSPVWGISSDTAYLIQEVVLTAQEDGSRIEYFYDITFGGRYQGLQLFLESLAEEETVDTLDTSIDTIKPTSDYITIAESIQRNSHLRTANATVTVAETISKTNVTPPWKWAPSATKKAKWNEAEWG